MAQVTFQHLQTYIFQLLGSRSCWRLLPPPTSTLHSLNLKLGWCDLCSDSSLHPPFLVAPSSSSTALHHVIHSAFLPPYPPPPGLFVSLYSRFSSTPADGSVQRGPQAPLSVPLIFTRRQQQAAQTSSVYSAQYEQLYICTYCILYLIYIYCRPTHSVCVCPCTRVQSVLRHVDIRWSLCPLTFLHKHLAVCVD